MKNTLTHLRRSSVVAPVLLFALVAAAVAASFGAWSDAVSARTSPAEEASDPEDENDGAEEPAEESVELPAPEIAVEPIDSTSVEVSWTEVDGADGYHVERDGELIVDDLVETEYVDSGLDSDTEYTYRVRAFANVEGAGDVSEPDPGESDEVDDPVAPVDPGGWVHPEGEWTGEDAEALGFPGPNTTGALTPRDELPLADFDVITRDMEGQTIENVRFESGLRVWASDVTLRNVWIDTESTMGGIFMQVNHPTVPPAENLTIEDTTIVCHGDKGQQSIGNRNYTAIRVNVSGCHDGFRFGHNTSIIDSYSHSLNRTEMVHDPGANTHNDNAQTTGGENIRIEGNTFLGPWQRSTSAILLQAKGAPIDDVSIRGNLLQGGGYTVYMEGVDQPGPTGVEVHDNVFVHDSPRYGYWRIRSAYNRQPTEVEYNMSGNVTTRGENIDQ